MAKRWFVSPVIGTGTRIDPYRAKATDKRMNLSAVIPSNADGTPKFNWALCLMGGTDFSQVDADGEIEPIPGATLDDTLGSLPANQRNRMENFLTNRGVDLTGLTDASTIGDVLDRIVGSLDPLGNYRNLRVKE